MADMIFEKYTIKSISAETPQPISICFKPDGLIMYVLDLGTKKVYQYTLSIAWNAETAVYANKYLNTSSQVTGAAFGLYIKPDDGTELYVSDRNANKIFQYTLSTGWSVDTGSYASKYLDVSAQSTCLTSFWFKADGVTLYVQFGDNAGFAYIFQYTLSTGWSVDTGSYASKTKNISSDTLYPIGVYVNSTGTKLYLADDTNFRILQYSFSAAWDINTISLDAVQYNCSSFLNIVGLFFESDGSSLFVLGYLTGSVYRVKLVNAWEAEPLAWQCGRTFPINESAEVNVVVDYSDGRQLYAYNKGVEETTIPLVMENIEQADYDNFKTWLTDVAVGPLNTFIFIDEASVEHTVRMMDTKNPLREVANGIYSGTITLREEI